MMKKETRQYISQLTRIGQQKRVQSGKINCALPLGYIEQDGKVIIDPVDGPKVKWMFELRAAGLSLSKIQQTIVGSGLRTRKGNLLGVSTIHAMLRNPFYRGQIRFRGELHDGRHPRIVD